MAIIHLLGAQGTSLDCNDGGDKTPCWCPSNVP